MLELDRSKISEIGKLGLLFPRSITADEWVLYHGTSNVFSARIEREGLSPKRALLNSSRLRRLTEIFRRLGWDNLHHREFYILDPTNREAHPGVHLSESPITAANFATRKYCGGEWAWAIRSVLPKLKNSPGPVEIFDGSKESSPP